jgi:hypothetical protein
MHSQRIVSIDADRAAQAVDRQPLDQVLGCRGLAIEQEVVAVGPHEEIEQAFALRSQQPRPDRQRPGHIACHQSLQEPADVLTGQANHGTVGQGGRSHDHQLGSAPWHRKP